MTSSPDRQLLSELPIYLVMKTNSLLTIFRYLMIVSTYWRRKNKSPEPLFTTWTACLLCLLTPKIAHLSTFLPEHSQDSCTAPRLFARAGCIEEFASRLTRIWTPSWTKSLTTKDVVTVVSSTPWCVRLRMAQFASAALWGTQRLELNTRWEYSNLDVRKIKESSSKGKSLCWRHCLACEPLWT